MDRGESFPPTFRSRVDACLHQFHSTQPDRVPKLVGTTQKMRDIMQDLKAKATSMVLSIHDDTTVQDFRHIGYARLLICQRTNDVCYKEFPNTLNSTIPSFRYVQTKSLKPGPACIANGFTPKPRGARPGACGSTGTHNRNSVTPWLVRSTVCTSTGRIPDSNLRELKNHTIIPVTVT